MLAVIASILANTSEDGEGKHFIYRRSTGRVSTGLSLPDPSMMHPEDFLPKYGADLLLPDATGTPAGHKGMSDAAAESLVQMLVAQGAQDLRARKMLRDKPRA